MAIAIEWPYLSPLFLEVHVNRDQRVELSEWVHRTFKTVASQCQNRKEFEEEKTKNNLNESRLHLKLPFLHVCSINGKKKTSMNLFWKIQFNSSNNQSKNLFFSNRKTTKQGGRFKKNTLWIFFVSILKIAFSYKKRNCW